jgi:3-deoxy-D-manno-octulosonic-acid transferase
LIQLFLIFYDLIWRLAFPFLRKKPRLAIGWDQRTLRKWVEGPFDLWIQAASGGESMMTKMVIDALSSSLPSKQKLRILLTSGTKQGIDSLHKGVQALTDKHLDISIAFFPFDCPHLMRKAFKYYRPRLAVTVETELWPGFLVIAAQEGVPVYLINGRMSAKSFASYRRINWFFRRYRPLKIWAISPKDRDRFRAVMGMQGIELMNNIKFDRIIPKTSLSENNAITRILPPASPFVLLGSIRREEEEKILATVVHLLDDRPDLCIGLFPKHVERADHWLELLGGQNIKSVKRSTISGHQSAGTVIVWDVFGELAGAYASAAATFVGGSLVNLGGQNFLEPLVFGIRPIIGPYWENFAWVGREIVTSGLVLEVNNEEQLTHMLLASIDETCNRKEIQEKVRKYFEPRKGGTQLVCRELLKALQLEPNDT